jgi:Ca-activated chloride channel family protein
MKQLVIILLILISGVPVFAQKEKGYIKMGNELYNQKKYPEAAVLYNKAVEKKKESVEGQFNLGDALYKQKQFDKAAEQFKKISEVNKDKAITARAYHNLGNTLLENNKLEESIDAYKKALLNNPKDEETRYNLAYALEKLKQQKDKDKKNKDKNKDNKQDQDKKNQDDKDKNKDQNKKDQDKKDQDKQNKDQQQQPPPDKISKEDAQRMLDALNNQEKQTQEKLKGKKVKASGGKPLKDW